MAVAVLVVGDFLPGGLMVSLPCKVSPVKIKVYITASFGRSDGTRGVAGGGGRYRGPDTQGACFFSLRVRLCIRRGAGMLGQGGRRKNKIKVNKIKL